MRRKERNALIFVIDDFLSLLETKLGIFGPFSFKLLAGLLLGIFSLLFFAKLSEDLLFNELLVFDKVATQSVRFFGSKTLNRWMTNISLLGSPFFLAVVGVLAMIYTGLIRKHLWDTVLIPTSLGGGMILNTVLKLLFQRQRPDLTRLVEVSGYSFPSGHSMMSFIFYGLLIYMTWLNFSDKTFRLFGTLVLTGVILAIGISRVYLGVHFPSDVLAGFAAGSFWLVACIVGLRGIRYYKAGGGTHGST